MSGTRTSRACVASLGLGLAMALAACTGASPRGGADGTFESIPPGGASSVGAAPGGAPNDRWDPRSWTPTVKVVPPSLTEQDKEEFRTSWLAQIAHSENLADPPEVEMIRWVEGSADYAQTVVPCMTDAGFHAEADPAGGMGIYYPDGVPAAQEAAMNLAYYTCSAKYSIDPLYLQEWTDDQLGLIYDYWDQFYIPCLKAHGVTVDTAQEPSREAYIAAFHTPQRLDWWPMDVLTQMPATRVDVLDEACAQYPPDDVFYGS